MILPKWTGFHYFARIVCVGSSLVCLFCFSKWKADIFLFLYWKESRDQRELKILGNTQLLNFWINMCGSTLTFDRLVQPICEQILWLAIRFQWRVKTSPLIKCLAHACQFTKRPPVAPWNFILGGYLLGITISQAWLLERCALSQESLGCLRSMHI